MPILGTVGGSLGYGRGSKAPGKLVTVELWGAGGGPGTVGGWNYGSDGGGGGYTFGQFEIFDPCSLRIITGRQGNAGDWWGAPSDGLLGGTTNGGTLIYGAPGGASSSNDDNRYSGGGGGFTGVFINGYSSSECLAIAGGGGGGSSGYAPTGSGSNPSRGGGGGGIIAQSGVQTSVWGGQNGFALLPDGTTRKQVFTRSIDQGNMYSLGGSPRNAARYYGGTTYSYSYGGGGGGGWYGGDSGSYYNPNPYQMGGGAGGSGYTAGQQVAYPDLGFDYNRCSNWFGTGYFGVMRGANSKLPNSTTYTFANMCSPGTNNGTQRMWLLIVENTSGNNFRTQWAGLFTLPSISNSAPFTLRFSDALSTVGSPEVPATGDYYMAWLSGNPADTSLNPASSLWGYGGNSNTVTNCTVNWIIFGSISGGATPSADKVYTTNDGGGSYTVALAYGGYRNNELITTSSSVRLLNKGFTLYPGRFRDPGFTGGNYPGGSVGVGCPEGSNNSNVGRGYARITVSGTVYTYDYSTTGGSVQTISIT